MFCDTIRTIQSITKGVFIVKQANILSALLLAIPLAACAGSDPYTGLQTRMGRASTMANNIVIEAQDTLRCPKNMKPIEHEVQIRTDSSVEYTEEHGRSSGGSHSRRNGGYATYSGADITVEAETEAESRGELRCVPIIDLTPERR